MAVGARRDGQRISQTANPLAFSEHHIRLSALKGEMSLPVFAVDAVAKIMTGCSCGELISPL